MNIIPKHSIINIFLSNYYIMKEYQFKTLGKTRTERDLLGEKEVPTENNLQYGIEWNK